MGSRAKGATATGRCGYRPGMSAASLPDPAAGGAPDGALDGALDGAVAGPSGVIRLTIPGWGPFTPTVHVGDRLVRVRYGTQDLAVPAGRVTVRAHVTAVADYGHAELEVWVEPGAVETVHYAVPWTYGLPGVMTREAPSGWRRIAPSPQAALIVVVVVAFVVYGLLR